MEWVLKRPGKLEIEVAEGDGAVWSMRKLSSQDGLKKVNFIGSCSQKYQSVNEEVENTGE